MSSLALCSTKNFNSWLWHLVLYFTFVFAFVFGSAGCLSLPRSTKPPRTSIVYLGASRPSPSPLGLLRPKQTLCLEEPTTTLMHQQHQRNRASCMETTEYIQITHQLLHRTLHKTSSSWSQRRAQPGPQISTPSSCLPGLHRPSCLRQVSSVPSSMLIKAWLFSKTSWIFVLSARSLPSRPGFFFQILSSSAWLPHYIYHKTIHLSTTTSTTSTQSSTQHM